MPALRQRVAARMGFLDAADVMITAGAVEASFLAIVRLVGRGDEMIVDVPGWPQPLVLGEAIGATVRRLPRSELEGWSLDLDRLADLLSPRTRLIFLSNPNRPTGRLLSAEELHAVVELAARVGAHVLCDEVYAGLEWIDRPTPHAVNLYERGISVGSLSKTLGLRGLRIGWLASRERRLLFDAMVERETTGGAPNVLGEAVACAALGEERYAAALARARLHGRRSLEILDRFVTSASFLRWQRPQAGLSGFARFDLPARSDELFDRLRRALDPAFVLPGSAYGYPRHLRLDFGSHEENALELGLERLSRCLEPLRPKPQRAVRPPVDGGKPSLQGPVERRLAALVEAHLGSGEKGSGSGQSGMTIEICNRPRVGDFKVNLAALPDAGGDLGDRCREVARRLSRLEEIEKALAIPPRVFLRTTLDFLADAVAAEVAADPGAYGNTLTGRGRTALVSFSNPNANKPLHLGHLRNNFLGMALSNLLEAQGYRVYRTAVLSDWGIHICQAALAYARWGNGQTPESAGRKSDSFVGELYVRFHAENATARRASAQEGSSADPAETPLEREAAELLHRVEEGDAESVALLERVVGWATRGIERTHARIGTRHDTIFLESDAVARAKRMIARAVERGQCRRRADGSVCVDLTDRGLEEITLLRADGSTLATSQIMGMCVERHERYHADQVWMIAGEEWKAGLSALIEVLRKLGHGWAGTLEAVTYGMVNLPEGRMKSRQGRIVEADDLLDSLREIVCFDGGEHPGKPPAAVRETLAAGLLKHYMLGAKRPAALWYDEKRLLGRSLREFTRLLVTAAGNGDRPHGGARTGRAPSRPQARARRRILLQANAFSRVIDAAVAKRDPGHLLHYLGSLCRLAPGADPQSDPRVERALGAVLRRGLRLLNVDLPADLDG